MVYKGLFEIKIEGGDELLEVKATFSFDTERVEREPYSDGRGRGWYDAITGATLERMTADPLAYDRDGAIDFIGVDAVLAMEAEAIERGGDL